MIPDTLRGSRVLVVDDEPANVQLLEALLRRWGLRDVACTTDSSQVVDLCAVRDPDLVLLDLDMPGPDGFEVLSQLLPWTRAATALPVIVLTEEAAPDVRRRAIARGARDFLAKPFDLEEVRLRTANLLETRHLQRELWRQRDLLEGWTRQRTEELEQVSREALARLAGAAEYRDDDTGEHTRRVGRSAALIARELGQGPSTVEMIELAAALHDVGKVAVPDAILRKPGPLTAQEFDVIRRHVEVGQRLLDGSGSDVLRMACRIALTHHERWDGTGYVQHLSGDSIPLEGCIVAVADMFDALTHDRPYRPAWEVSQARDAVLAEAGRAFDPSVVAAFGRLDHAALLDPIADPAPAEPARTMPSAPNRPLGAGEPEHGNRSGNGNGNGNGRMVTLRDAARALSVSPATLRRWNDAGRISAQRTAGGHRRFPIEEIRRLQSEIGARAGTVRRVPPPPEPIPSLAELLTEAASEIHDHAAHGLYEDRAAGWFRSEAAAKLVAHWARTVAAASFGGDYQPARSATAGLAASAEAAGTSLLERYTYLERFSSQALRRLADPPGAPHGELVAARRLLGSLRQHVLAAGELPG